MNPGVTNSTGKDMLKVGGKTLIILCETVWSMYRISGVYLLTAAG